MRNLIKQLAEKYGATATFNIEHDSFWKSNSMVATVTGFKDMATKELFQHEVDIMFIGRNMGYRLIGAYNPDTCQIKWDD